MDKNTVIGIVLIAALIIGFSVLNKPSKEEQLAAQRRQDSIMNVQKELAVQHEIEQRLADSLKEESKNLPDSVSKQELDNQYGSFSDAAKGEMKFYTLENELIKLSVSNKGGRPYSVELKKYKTYDQKPLILFNGDSTVFGLIFWANNRDISTNNLFFKASKSESNGTSKLSMKLYVDSTSYIEYIYSLAPNSYMMDFDIKLHGMEDIIASNTPYLDIEWEMYVPRQEKGAKNENIYTTIYYKNDEDVKFFNARRAKEEEAENIPTKVKWIAFKHQFFSSIMIPDDDFLNADIESSLDPSQEKYLKFFSSKMRIPYDPRTDNDYSMRLYYGPNHFTTLKKFKGLDLQYLAFQGKGITRWINQFIIIPIFNWLNNFIGNYGIIILLLTIIIKIGLLPLTYKSYMSQAKMRVLKPQIDEINKKYPKGKEMEKQQATMALYKKVGVSPLGGCLPMLLQMPILFAMFRFFPTSIELRQESFLWAKDLSTYDAIFTWSPDFWPFITRTFGNHLSLFTLLMTVTTILSMKFNNQTANTGNQMPGMKGMMYVMPVMFMFILNKFSAALTYYYFLTNIITFGQNFLFKRLVNDEEILRKLNEKKGKEPKKKSNWQKRMELAAKQRGMQAPKRR